MADKRLVPLLWLAHARSGDKGDMINIGLIAREAAFYPLLETEVTAERVKQHFAALCRGRVERHALPNLLAFNFLLYESLDGGGTLSLRTDAQGKTASTNLLRMQVQVNDELAVRLAAIAGRAASPDS